MSKAPNITKPYLYNSIELFAGAGGLALGLEKAGIYHLLLNEIDKHASATLRKIVLYGMLLVQILKILTLLPIKE